MPTAASTKTKTASNHNMDSSNQSVLSKQRELEIAVVRYFEELEYDAMQTHELWQESAKTVYRVNWWKLVKENTKKGGEGLSPGLYIYRSEMIRVDDEYNIEVLTIRDDQTSLKDRLKL